MTISAVGALRQSIGTIPGVAEQWTMRQQLRAARSFAQATLDALHNYVCVIDATGTVVQVSEGWRAFAGAGADTPEAKFIGANYFETDYSAGEHDIGQAKKFAEGVRATLRGVVDEFAMDTPRHWADGQRCFSSKATRFTAGDGDYVVVSHEDITDRKKSERELCNLRSQQWHAERVARTGLLISSLAHELSQPLAGILSNAQAGLRFLASDRVDPREIRDILRDIVSDDKRAGEIIESLRVMLRRQATERKHVNVADIVYDVSRLLHSELVEMQVNLESTCDGECFVMADRAQIQQVLLNLMMNGLDAIRSAVTTNRRLAITVSPTGEGDVRIAVRDSGVGITQQEFAQVFDAFWTTKSRGTGMGLAICRSIVESHGGRIWVEGSDGEGSTFVVVLPVAAQHAQPAMQGHQAADSS